MTRKRTTQVWVCKGCGPHWDRQCTFTQTAGMELGICDEMCPIYPVTCKWVRVDRIEEYIEDEE